MTRWHRVRDGEAPTVADQRFSNSAYELTEWYLYANGWALRVVTDLAGGALGALSRVTLMRRNPHWLTGDPPAFEIHGDAVPKCPWPRRRVFTDGGVPVSWFNEDGESPDLLVPEALAEVSAAVSGLEPRPDE